jgi:hypothetical protein
MEKKTDIHRIMSLLNLEILAEGLGSTYSMYLLYLSIICNYV